MSINYPLKFKPILKETIWGGEKLMTFLNKQSDEKNIGESWEISSVDRNISIVANGKLKGESLENLLIIYRDALVGKKVFNEFSYKFPLLIKYIDAKEALSIQLHPNDKLAKERHNSFGKTEMWYVMQADEGGNLIVGFKENSNKEEYLEHLQHKSLLEILNVDKVQKGDVYFIPTGRVHAIGAGVMLAEIQQTSDVTYRIYDWDRKDTRGNYRKLHTELALDAIDYKAQEEYRTAYNKTLNNQSNIVDCQYFTTNIVSIEGKVEIDHSNKDSFVIYMCVKGEATIHYGEGEVETVSYGETVLMPAILKEFSISSKNDSELLEIYIK
jgi:mannose-6-phosphate isomerase